MKSIFRVTKRGDIFSVKTSDGGSFDKRNLVLQELGNQHENQYSVSLTGGLAQLEFQENDLVAAALRFQTRDYNGQTLQDITVKDIVKLKP